MDDNKDTLGYGRGWHRKYTEAPNELWEEKCTLTPAQVVIYIYLLSCVNVERNGCTAWPTYETISNKVRLTSRTVITNMNILVDRQYIYKKHRFKDNKQISNMYLLNHPTATRDWV